MAPFPILSLLCISVRVTVLAGPTPHSPVYPLRRAEGELPFPSPTTLNQKIINYGKRSWGVATDPYQFSIPAASAILSKEFGTITPENSMKWDATEPARGTYTFTKSDELVQWATSHGKLIRGYTLVWHSQLPSWVSSITDKNTLTSVIQSHIAAVAGRYKGKVLVLDNQWDVVNEVLTEAGALRPSVFSKVFNGDEFITLAFTTARQVDPSAKLFINEYNIDSLNPKLAGLVNLVNKINAGDKGKLIDGIGTETHIGAGGSSTVEAALTELAKTGTDIAITELDISGSSSADYTTVVKACIRTPSCTSITSWALTESDTWSSGTKRFLWDNSYKPRPAYHAIMALPYPIDSPAV